MRSNRKILFSSLTALLKNKNLFFGVRFFSFILLCYVLGLNAANAQINYRSSTSAAASTTTLSINKPTGTAQGDVMILNIAQPGSNTAISTPSGWTLIIGATIGSGGNKNYGSVFYKVAGAGEPASYAFTLNSINGVGSISSFTGVDNINPIEASSSNVTVVNSAQNAASATSISTVNPNAAVLMLGQAIGTTLNWSSWSTATSPGSLTEIADMQNASASVGVAWALKAAAGSTGTGTASVANTTTLAGGLNGGILIALKRAAYLSGTATTAAFTTTYGTPSAAQNFPISGNNLNGVITVTAPAGFQVSTDGINFSTSVTYTPTNGVVTATVYIRLAPTAPVGFYNSFQVSLSSSGATTLYITTPASGNSVSPCPLTITANNISKCFGSNYVFLGNEYSSSGLQNGETIGSVTLTSSGSPAAAATGTYAITPTAANGGSFLSNNYSITYVNGILTVNPSIPASVNIAASNTTICAGASVTFTATPTNGGATPAYQWKVNGVNAGTNSSTFTTSTLANNDVVTVVMTSNATPCLTGSPATSNAVTMTVNPNLTASVSIVSSATSNTICAGNSVTFTATPTNGGASPSYQWYVGTTAVGTNSNTYTTTGLSNGDIVKVVMTSNASPCLQNTTATSNTITTTVNPILNAAVSIVSNAAGNTICAGTSVTFTATATNGGAAPSYQWKLNGSNVGTNSATYTSTTLANNDVVSVVMTSNATPCLAGSPATSNLITMTVNPILTANVSIVSDAGSTICAGTSVTFTATPTNGGTTPSYQWYIGATPVGTNSSTFTTNTLTNANAVKVVMTSNASPCLSGSPATSNTITMTVNPVLNAGVSITSNAAGNTICAGATVIFTATPTNGGTVPAYQWKVNGTNVGTNSSTYTTTGLSNGDVVIVVMTSNASPCLSGSPATSNAITMTVNPVLPASVNIAASNTTICAGASVTFTATPTNGGATPAYQWKVNGVNAGTNSSAFTSSSLVNGDNVTIVMTSNAACVSGSPATSNTITMTVNANLPASVTIVSNAVSNTICSGANVTFTATPTNGGISPSYQWKVNGINISGATSNTFTTNSLSNGNIITVLMTSSATCVSGSPATSNAITMTVNALPSTVTATSSIAINCGSTPVLLTGTASGETRSTSGYQGFETSGNTISYTATGSGQILSGISSNSASPANTNLYSSATSSYGVNNGTAIITTGNITGLGNLSSKTISFRLASFATGTSDAADANDSVKVEVSINGGTTFSNELVVTGNTNAFWSFTSGTGTATKNYSGTNTPLIFAPAGGGGRIADGYSTVQVNLPDTVNQVILRISLINNSNKEQWLVDDITLTKTNMIFAWTSNPSGFSSVLQNPGYANTTTSTVYTLTATNGNGCSASASTTVTINPKPAQPLGTNNSRCGSGNITISAMVTGTNEVIDWYASPTGGTVMTGGSGTNNLTLNSLSATTIYYAESRNTITGCVSTVRTPVTATINNLPTIFSITDGAICFSGTTTLSATTVSGGTINWYSNATGGTLLLSNSNNYTTPNINTTTSYYAEAVSAAGCIGPVRMEAIVTVNPLPASPVEVPGAFCGTGSVLLSANVTGGITVDWYDVPNGGTVLAGGLGVPVNFSTPTISSTTVFFAQARNLITGCLSAARTPVTATIHPIPNPPSNSGINYAICGSGSTVVAVNVNGVSETVDWYAGATGGTVLTSGSATTSFVIPVISTSTVFYAQTRNTVTGCISATRTPVNVTVNPLPATPVVTGASVCDQGVVNLSATSSSGTVVDWYNDASGNTLFLSSSNNYTTPLLNATTVYYVVSRNSITGCLSAPRTPVAATVNPNLPASVTISSNAANNTICAGSTITFTATPVNGGSAPVYQWMLNGVNVGTNSSVYSTSSISGGQTVSVRMTSNATPCLIGSPTVSNPITVSVNPNAGLATGFDSTICGPGEVTIRAVAGANEVIDWYNAAIGGTLLASSSNRFTTPNITTSSVYYAVARNINTGCVSVTRTAVNAIIASVPVVNCPGDFSVCTLNPITINGLSPAGGVLTTSSPGLSGNVFNPAAAGGVGRYDFTYTYTNTQGCSSRCNFSIQAATTPPVVTPSSPSYFIYSGTSTNIVLNSNMLGTTYTWTVVNTASTISGFSNQTTPVTGPIVQTLFNNGNVAGELSYIITPSLNGTCQGTPVTVYVTIPNSTFCDDPGSFLAGSCIINMGITPQTIGNGLKPYGLVYELVNNYKIPVYWCFRDNKNFQSSVTKVDQIDFTLDGINYRGGTFVIPSTFVPQVQSVINSWVSQGVVVAYSSTSFTPPVYDIITRMPNVVLDANTGDLLQSGFYVKAGIPASAYTLGGIPTNITGCDDIYALPHALPQNWTQATKDSLRNFINTRGWLYTSCCSVSGIENIPNLNFLTTNGLVPYANHAAATVPYNYSLRPGSEGVTVASDPFMQFTGTLDGAINYGLENVYLPVSSWRPTTRIAIFDSNYVNNSTTYPNNAAILAYGRAYGDTSKGMVMYMAGHDFEHGTVAEDVAAARVYGNFILRAGINARPKIIPVNIPAEGFSGQTLPISVSVPPTQSSFVSYEWFSDIGALFGANALSTTITLPSVDVITVANIQFKVKDACGRIGFYCTTIRIYPTIVNNHISASQSLCAGLRVDTLRGTSPAVQSGRPLSYQWSMSTTGSASGFSPAPGVNNQKDYMPPVLTAGDYWFRRKVTSDTISVYSSSIQITIKPSPTVVALINNASHDISLCNGQSASLSSTGLNAVDTLTYLSLSNVQDRSIPDNNTRGIRDTINVSGAPATMSQLLNISVKVNVSHTYASDVELYLIRPGGSLTQTATGNYTNTIVAGQSIALIADRGGAGANFIGTVFTDSATVPIGTGIAPFTGYYKPENAFSTLTATANPNGNWILVAVDDGATDIGSILDWTITMKFRNNISYTWSSIPSGFTSTLQNPGMVNPTVSTSYIVTVNELNNTCTGKDTLNAIVSPLSVAGTISGPISTCSPSADSIKLTGYVGTIQWQSSSDDLNYTNISGANSSVLLLSSFTANTYFRAVVKSGACASATSASFFVSITPAPTVSNAGVDQVSLCSTTTTLAANTPVVGLGSWSIISGGGGIIASVNDPYSSFTGQLDSSYILRWTIVNSPCSASTDDVIIRFNGAVAIVSQPVPFSTALCLNSTNTLTVGVTGSAPFNYQWYSNATNANTGGTPVSGANATTFAPPTSSIDARYYYCVVSNACGIQTSNTVAITVVPTGSWLGLNTDWNNPSNWCGGVPDEDDDIIIPSGLSNYPVISTADAVVHDIKLQGGSITILNSGSLNLYGAVTQSGGIINARNGTLEFTGDTTQVIGNGLLTGSYLGNLIINNATVELGGPLNLLNKISFKGNDRVLQTNDFLTLKSSDTLTASVGDITNNETSNGNMITGKVTVERFASSRRAWRLLSMPTRHDYQTIKQAWQENASTPNSNPVPGFGIQVTSNRSSWLADGFDTLSPAGPSVKWYNPVTSLYDGITSTNNYFEIGKAYMTFIRGDRSITQLSQSPTITTIREKATLFTGNLTTVVGTASGQFVSVGNPYPSAISFAKLSKTNLDNAYYLWDPKLSTYGAYQTCLVSGNTIFSAPGGGSYGSGNYNIQSGQGFFVRTNGGAGSITFKESAKVDGSSQFNRAPVNLSTFRTNLYQLQNGNPVLYDGVLNIFDSTFTNSEDPMDVPKLGNFNENLSIRKADKFYAIESRSSITDNDTIRFRLGQVRVTNYIFEFIPENMTSMNVQAFFEDSYLNSRIPLSMTDTARVNFSIANIPGSYAADRFRIVFNTLRPLPVGLQQLMANRNSDKTASVTWKSENETAISHYIVERSFDGATFNTIGISQPEMNNGGTAVYIYKDDQASAGVNYYRIKAVSQNGLIQYSNIARVNALELMKAITVAPNPVLNKEVNVVFNNEDKGLYQASFYTSDGKLIQQSDLLIDQSYDVKKIKLKKSIPSGQYQLVILSPEQKRTIISIQIF